MRTNQEKKIQTSQERLSEVGVLLANAIYRLKAKETSKNRDFSLDFSGTPSIHRDTLIITEKDYE